MARYIVPAEMPKSCAHCHFSVLKYQHPFFSKEKPNTKGYFCPFEGLTLELDFYDYTTKADWCPLVAIEDTADVVPKSDIIPCNIGDEVYAVKPYRNCKRIYKGKVTQMYFVGEEMKLAIVVNTVVRGEWGKAVFATEEEAKRSIEGDSDAE